MRHWLLSTGYIVRSTVILLGLTTCASAQEVPLHGASVVRFATVKEGAAVLGREDRYTKALSRFDLQSRLQTDQEVTSADLRKFAAKQVIAWPEQDVKAVSAALAAVRKQMAAHKLNFPKTVLFIHTNGRDEGRAAYCRQNAVILPRNMVRGSKAGLERLVAHELFHILSSHNPKLRDKLYEVVGFKRCGEVPLPPSLKNRKITNPDAPSIEHYVDVKHEGQTVHAVPILYSSAEKYDVVRGGTFFRYMKFKLMLVEQHGERWGAKLVDGKPVLLDPRKTASYFEAIGRNTGYIIHPEEVLADNFVLLLSGKQDVRTPRVLEGMLKVIKEMGEQK
ncbi:MAG: hypothetical protein IID44_02440 [Planctomycetes bacterium]|nr:hypothetical protein [Planctomycetota bacterium]